MKKLIFILTVISLASCNNYQSDIDMLKKSNDSLNLQCNELSLRCDTLEHKFVKEQIRVNNELIEIYERFNNHLSYRY